MIDVRLRLLAHPVSTGALALLALNDAVLKTAYPGRVTGKLSDLAGVVLLTWALGTLSRRPVAAAALVAVAFTSLKTAPGVAELLAPALGGITRRDATDLLALLALVPTVSVLRNALRDNENHDQGRRPRGRGAAARTALAIAVTGVAALGTGATSCVQPSRVAEIRALDGVLWANEPSGARRLPTTPSSATTPGSSTRPSSTLAPARAEHEWARSTDAGRTWRYAPLPASVPSATDQVCDQRLGCFRVSPGRDAVLHRPPGATVWHRGYAFSDEDKRRLHLRSGRCDGRGGTINLSKVVLVEGPGGQHVIAGADTQGILQRTPDGTWHRRSATGADPTPLNGPSQLAVLHGHRSCCRSRRSHCSSSPGGGAGPGAGRPRSSGSASSVRWGCSYCWWSWTSSVSTTCRGPW